jgi:hypothetical protein
MCWPEFVIPLFAMVTTVEFHLATFGNREAEFVNRLNHRSKGISEMWNQANTHNKRDAFIKNSASNACLSFSVAQKLFKFSRVLGY